MANNPFGFRDPFALPKGRKVAGPLSIGVGLGGSQKTAKRTLSIRDKQILWNRAGKKCEACGKKVEFDELQVGHKKAYSRGGSTTMSNSVCLCYRCNKLQGTDSWATFMRKMGKDGAVTVTSPRKSAVKKKPKAPRSKNPPGFGGSIFGGKSIWGP